MNHRRSLVAAAALLSLLAAPAHAVLERAGPVSNAPTVGGYPSWFQDKTGVTFEFCDPRTQSELNGGWCVILPGDVTFPEAFPGNFFNEHFYYDASNVLLDAANSFKAKLIVAVEGAFSNGPVVPGDQITFGRLRLQTTGVPFDGDYRVITPFSETVYTGQTRGTRIFDTLDVGIGCPGVFDCTLGAAVGPFLLPSAQAGGAEVPAMPDLKTAPAGTDPFYDLAVAQGAAPTADPGTGRRYAADPARVGPVTGSPLANFSARDVDGTSSARNHNTFRIEVSDASGRVFYTLDGETNFTVNGRLVDGALAGAVGTTRAVYKANASGNVTATDVFTSATPSLQARIPTQPQAAPVQPILAFYDQPCGGAITTDPTTGAIKVNPGPYTAPASAAHTMLVTGTDYWGQSQPGGLPASHVCIADTTARNAAGQTVPVYYLRKLTDEVTVALAAFNGLSNGTLNVTATSSDPTAILTLAGYGPATTTAGTSTGVGAGGGLDLAGNAATVTGLQSPPNVVQVVSSKGGTGRRNTDTGTGTTVLAGVPTAVADAATMFEDCAPTAATACAPGQGVTVDLLANDTILVGGQVTTLRNVVNNNLGTVVVTASAGLLGTATVSPSGILSYTPNANANGTESITYSVSVNGTPSNQSQVTIDIKPVNDLPVAANVTVGAVATKLNVINLIANSTDPDGNGDVKDAVILSWPPQLGTQPVPVNGVISYTPTTTGAFSFNFQVKDVAGAVSANAASATVNVAANEIIVFGKHQYVQPKNRWTVDGTDNIIEGQTITVVYENGTLVGATAPCNGTATNPNCVIGTAVVDGLGNWLMDKVGVSGPANPKSGTTVWKVAPTFIRAFSTLPSLGGTAAIDIVFK